MNANLIHMINQRGSATPGQPGLADLRMMWSLFNRRWPVLCGAVVITLATATVWLLLATPRFTATSTVLIDPRKTNTVQSEAIVSDLALDINTIATEVSLIKSVAVSRRVIERLRLLDDPSFTRTPANFSPLGWLARMFSRRPGGVSESDGAEKSRLIAANDSQPRISPELLGVIDRVQGATNVRRLATTYFIEISYSDPDPELAAKLANAVVQSYLDEQLEARYQATQRAATWLSDRVSTLRGQLEASERALTDHRAKFNLAKQQDGTLAEQQAIEINTQLVAARAQTVEKKAKYDQVQSILEDGVGIESVAAVMDSAAIATLRTQETAITREEAELLLRYGPKHPSILKIRSQHAEIDRQIKREVGRVVAMLKTDYEFAQEKEQSLASSLQELTASHAPNDQSIIRLQELERDADSNRTLYKAMLARSKEVEQQTSLQNGESRIAAPAFVPDTPSFPKKPLVLLVAIFAGLLTGVGIIALLEYLENGFTAATQIEKMLDLPVLAMVPMLSEAERTIKGRIASIAQYATLKPQSRFGESIRSARLTTQMSDIDQPPRLILVTSSISAEGKTSIAMSLALSAAASPKKVLLIDCDLRAQSATKQFNLIEKPGLTNLLTEQSAGEAAVFHTVSSNLTILPAGTVTCNPPDILGSKRMRALLQTLRDSYDVIYIDAPPLLPVIDSVVLSKFVDKIVFIVRWRTTPRHIALRAVQSIEDPIHKISGVALNGVRVDRLPSYDPYNTYAHKSYSTYYAQ